MIAETIARLRREYDLPVDVARRGPVPLERFYENHTAPRIRHFELASLTRGTVLAHLQSQGIHVEDLGGDPAETLVGFIFSNRDSAFAYVKRDGDTLGRQRFTAAHELGHAVLHHGRMGPYLADVTIAENSDSEDSIEREANRFAAELLMPREVCEARAEELKQTLRSCPRQVLAYRLASELLVSLQAMNYRLKGLEVGDV